MRPPAHDNRGQMALVDALVFLVLMGISSALLLNSAGHDGMGALADRGMRQYTDDLAGTLMEFGVSGLRYTVDGGSVELIGRSVPVSEALCDRTALEVGGTGQYDFSEYDDAIIRAARSISRPDTGLAIACGHGDAGDTVVFISDTVSAPGKLPVERYASTYHYMPDAGTGGGEGIWVTVYVWVMP